MQAVVKKVVNSFRYWVSGDGDVSHCLKQTLRENKLNKKKESKHLEILFVKICETNKFLQVCLYMQKHIKNTFSEF